MEMVSSSGRNCGIVALRTMAKQICKWGLVLGAIVLGACASAAAQSEVTVERGVKVPMRDGVILRADIYRPKQEGRFPVLLERTPYNKAGGADFGYKAAASGYVVIIQDVRGRYTSEGEWTRSATNPRMAMTRWNGQRHCPIPMGRWACLGALMWEQHKCLRLSRIHRIWQASVLW